MIIRLLLLGTLTVTSYRPVANQTRPECTSRYHCNTAIDDGITKFGVAVSRDLLAKGVVHYGDVLWIPGFGYRIVNDCMGVKARRSLDLMVFTRAEEKEVGVRHLSVWRIVTGLSQGANYE